MKNILIHRPEHSKIVDYVCDKYNDIDTVLEIDSTSSILTGLHQLKFDVYKKIHIPSGYTIYVMEDISDKEMNKIENEGRIIVIIPTDNHTKSNPSLEIKRNLLR